MINDFFNWCVYVLEVIGNVTGMGYELANIVIFVFPLNLLIKTGLVRLKLGEKKRNISIMIENIVLMK